MTSLPQKLIECDFYFFTYGDFVMHLEQWDLCSTLLKDSKVKLLSANTRHEKVLNSFLENKCAETIMYPFKLNHPSQNENVLARQEIVKQYNLDLEDKILLYTGRLTVQKNISTLIDIMEKLPSDYKLLLCGDFDNIINEQRMLHYLPGFYFSLINEQINKFNKKYENRVIYCGKKNSDELIKYYQAADIFVSLSTYTLEDYGVSPIEAYNYGCHLIVTDWGGYENLSQLSCCHTVNTSMTDTDTWVDIEQAVKLIKNANVDQQLEDFCEEIDRVYNQSFENNLEKVLLNSGENLKVNSTKSSWRLDRMKENLDFFKHFRFLASQTKKNEDFIQVKTYLKEANQMIVSPSSVIQKSQNFKSFSLNYYNYFANTLPVFVKALLENEKKLPNKIFFLRDKKISRSEQDQLLLKYPNASFLFLGSVQHEEKRFIACDLVQKKLESDQRKILLLNIILNEEHNLETLETITKNYEKVYVIHYSIHNYNVGDAVKSFIKMMEKFPNDKFEFIKIEDAIKLSTNEHLSYFELIDEELMGESFLSYYFSSRNIHVVGRKVSQYFDYDLSPYHGLIKR